MIFYYGLESKTRVCVCRDGGSEENLMALILNLYTEQHIYVTVPVHIFFYKIPPAATNYIMFIICYLTYVKSTMHLYFILLLYSKAHMRGN